MKALVISDPHSNPYALDAIWRKERDCDVVYCAGDVVDYGPFPKQAVAWLIEHRAVCVQGNHDVRVLECFQQRQAAAGVCPNERKWKHHNALLLDEAEAAFLAGLPQTLSFELDGIRYLMTHSYRGYEEIRSLPDMRQFLAQRFGFEDGQAPVRLILGHTHRLGMHYLTDEQLWLNPGSMSYRRPDDPSQEAHYITVTEGRVRLRRLSYDTRPLWQEARRHRLHEEEMLAARRFFRPPIDDDSTTSSPPGGDSVQARPG